MKAWWPEQESESSNLEPQTQSQESELETESLNSQSLPLVTHFPRPHFLKPPNTATNQEPSFQIPEPMGDILIQIATI